MTWTDEKLEQLKTLTADGLSARQIARILGDVTRSAVCGKIHRLKGTDGAPKLARNKGCCVAKAPQPKAPKPPRPARPQPQEPEPAVTDDAGVHLTPETIARRGQCRWPIGDPQEPGFYYCGHKTHGDYPYCEAHTARAYQPAKKGA